MSQPVPQITHPFEVLYHPTLDHKARRAILASWASDAAAIPDRPALRRPKQSDRPVVLDDVLAALRALDDLPPSAPRH